MRTLISIILCLMSSMCLNAQNDVTRFLGIPVDGFKPEMVEKLQAKGFVLSNHDKNVLEGEFNGTQVNVHIVTNNNKVYRIMLCDANTVGESDIRIRFNNLCRQFMNNKRYMSLEDYTIPEEEDISYEMTVKSKRYEALFYQQMTALDSTAVANNFKKIILEKYSEEELANPSKKIQDDVMQISMSYVMDIMTKKAVWFMISEYYGEYYISMFYDNEYNRANGEDL